MWVPLDHWKLNIILMKSMLRINKLKLFHFLIVIIVFLIYSCDSTVKDFSSENRLPLIIPDYADVIVPSNIAPLNFYVNEKGEKYHIEIYCEKNGGKIIMEQASPSFQISVNKWHGLLKHNKGKILNIDIYVKNIKWIKFSTIKDSIANEEIEDHLVYRLINSQYIYSKKMKLVQRSLEDFDESFIFENSATQENCFNCHAFCKNNPKKMSLHVRQFFPGTIILDNDKLTKLSTKTKFTLSAFGYPSWNPSGEYLAYSVNKFNEYFTNDVNKLNEVTDEFSDIIIYNIKTNTVTTSPKISTKSRENFPTWSPDGRWLYFISAVETHGEVETRYYAKYSLYKISYDPVSNTWGDIDTVLSANNTGKSITFPRISPDGRYLMFCMIDNGYFSINHKESDLYLMNLVTKEYHKLDINSPFNESYHAWSQSGRWFVFSSKRINGLFSQPYFSYFDKNGKAHKPFVMPQKDPLFYVTNLYNYNIPELISGKVDLYPRKVRDLLYTDPEKVQFDKSVDIDALSGATWIQSHP